jgi:hypothetical protein
MGAYNHARGTDDGEKKVEIPGRRSLSFIPKSTKLLESIEIAIDLH